MTALLLKKGQGPHRKEDMKTKGKDGHRHAKEIGLRRNPTNALTIGFQYPELDSGNQPNISYSMTLIVTLQHTLF
jgi:hypothetical protein